MAVAGYYRWPTLGDDELVFVSEDDLWVCPRDGGDAFRLTEHRGLCSEPCISPDGTHVAYLAREEGPAEVYCMPLAGGRPRRLSFTTASGVCGWDPAGRIVFKSSADQPSERAEVLFAVDPAGGLPEALPYGPAHAVAYGPRLVLGRNTEDPARWKRYRGGAVGVLFVADGDGFRPLVELDGNLACPMWLGERVFFISDHDGTGNLWSCAADGSDLRKETRHEDFYVRHAQARGGSVVYACGAALYRFDRDEGSRRLEVRLRSSRTQCQRRFVPASAYFESAELDGSGTHLAAVVRGKLLTGGPWEGPVARRGEAQGVRYRLAEFLPAPQEEDAPPSDREALLCISDRGGEERLELFPADHTAAPTRFEELDLGVALELIVASARRVLISNHRRELLSVDLEERRVEVLERNAFSPVQDLELSPCGGWLAYSAAETRETRSIILLRLEDRLRLVATPPLFRDVHPSFDPDGRFVCFLSCRTFHHGLESFFHDPEFRSGMRPYLVLLSAAAPDPFESHPRPPEGCDDKDDEEDEEEEDEEESEDQEEGAEADADAPAPILEIDAEGLCTRVLRFPVEEGAYGQIEALRGKVLYTVFPDGDDEPDEEDRDHDEAEGELKVYEWKSRKEELLLDGVEGFSLSRDRKALLVYTGHALRVLKAGEKPPEGPETPGRASGIVPWSRFRVEVEPTREWAQMFREIWRLQRDYFWVEDMGGVDWDACYARYAPLVERVGCRSEFSDLVWELHGELGTSHAYERGGDYARPPTYPVGALGADFAWDEAGGYRIERILAGEPWDPTTRSPLTVPGVDVRVGDVLLAVDQTRLGRHLAPPEALVHKAGRPVRLRLLRDGEEREAEVRTLKGERALRYRQWVLGNRARVHEASAGRLGYVHVPDMGATGYSDFMRHYFSEWNRDGLLVDVRYNGGGNVSQLILGRLTRTRLGYDVSRWETPEPYPSESVRGPLIALCNEHSGSDGDIFCHGFQVMGLGPLVGTRTWGGVIGILPRRELVDGSWTTQPEFAFWSARDGWTIENGGVTPDIEVALPVAASARDPQLEAAIAEGLRRLAELPPRPDFGRRRTKDVDSREGRA